MGRRCKLNQRTYPHPFLPRFFILLPMLSLFSFPNIGTRTSAPPNGKPPAKSPKLSTRNVRLMASSCPSPRAARSPLNGRANIPLSAGLNPRSGMDFMIWCCGMSCIVGGLSVRCLLGWLVLLYHPSVPLCYGDFCVWFPRPAFFDHVEGESKEQDFPPYWRHRLPSNLQEERTINTKILSLSVRRRAPSPQIRLPHPPRQDPPRNPHRPKTYLPRHHRTRRRLRRPQPHHHGGEILRRNPLHRQRREEVDHQWDV